MGWKDRLEQLSEWTGRLRFQWPIRLEPIQPTDDPEYTYEEEVVRTINDVIRERSEAGMRTTHLQLRPEQESALRKYFLSIGAGYAVGPMRKFANPYTDESIQIQTGPRLAAWANPPLDTKALAKVFEVRPLEK